MKKLILSLFILSSITTSAFAFSYHRFPDTVSISGNSIMITADLIDELICAYDSNYGYVNIEIQGGIQSIYYSFPYDDTSLSRVLSSLPVDDYYGVYIAQDDGAGNVKPTCTGYLEGDGNDLLFSMTGGSYNGSISTLQLNASQTFPASEIKYMYFALASNDNLYGVSGNKSAFVTYDIDSQQYFGKTNLHYFSYPSNLSNEFGSDQTGPAYTTSEPRHLRTFLCTEVTLGDGEECSANGYAYSMSNNLGYFDVYTEIINAGEINMSFTPYGPPPSPSGCGTGVELMICNATSSFMATTGFTPAQSVSSVGGMFIMPFIGGGIMMFQELSKWMITLAILIATVYFSYRAFKFYGKNNREKRVMKSHVKKNVKQK